MRELTTTAKLKDFMHSVGLRVRQEANVYFTGGVSSLIMGWRDSTIDIDLKFDPELDELFRALPSL